MKYYIFTYHGESLPIAYRLQQEGHDVIVGIADNSADTYSRKEKGMVKELPLWKKQRLSLFHRMVKKVPALDLVEKIKKTKNHSNSFVFFDRNNLFAFAQAVYDVDIAGNFPTEDNHLFEQDRERAKQFVRDNYPDITVAPVKQFSTVADAEKFLTNSKKVWVLKGGNDEAQTFVPETTDPDVSAKQIIQMLRANKYVYEKSGFILEQFITSVIELTPSKFYYDGEPVALTVNIENKPFGSGNMSIQTGTAQDLVFPISFSDKIHTIAFPSIVDRLAKQHKGLFYWDASLLIDAKTGEVYFGEFCSNRPGYNQLLNELAQLPSVHHYFDSIRQKKNPFTAGTVGASIRLFNMNRDTKTEQLGHSIPVSYPKNIEKNVWLWDVEKKRDAFLTVGYDWAVGVVTGSGTSVSQAVDAVYENIAQVSFSGGYYRPKFDFLSTDYETSIVNRLEYGAKKGLYKIKFKV